MISPYQQQTPKIEANTYIAPNAVITGDVHIGSESSIWFFAVLRGDVGPIRIGKRTNIQDHVIIHCSTGRSPAIIEDDVIIGHRAILHGCKIESEVLIGMGAIILDEAIIPKHTIIAAGALVPERKQLESGYLYAGIPASPIKKLEPRHIENIKSGAKHYIETATVYREMGISI